MPRPPPPRTQALFECNGPKRAFGGVAVAFRRACTPAVAAIGAPFGNIIVRRNRRPPPPSAPNDERCVRHGRDYTAAPGAYDKHCAFSSDPAEIRFDKRSCGGSEVRTLHGHAGLRTSDPKTTRATIFCQRGFESEIRSQSCTARGRISDSPRCGSRTFVPLFYSGTVCFSRPPTRTGSTRPASPRAFVSTKTAQSVAGPVAGEKRPPEIFFTKR